MAHRAVLTIAGSDSVAGAGIQADLKTFAAFRVYGVSALTAVTAQTTTGVHEVLALPPDLVRAQIEVLAHDVSIAAIKTGMLATHEVVMAVAEALSRLSIRNVVVDPVMAAGSGGTLLALEAVSTVKTAVLPLASVVTPNAREAAVLSGIAVDSLESAREAARRISDLGPAAVVITGGHLPGSTAVDVVMHRGALMELSAPRVDVGTLHGAGCTFASAIAARLALGDDIPDAVREAKRYVTGAIERSLEIGGGSRVLNHFWQFSL